MQAAAASKEAREWINNWKNGKTKGAATICGNTTTLRMLSPYTAQPVDIATSSNAPSQQLY